MELNSKLINGLKKIGITEMTPIQKECIEPVLTGCNVIACSGTGTGKTFAYLLPVISANADNNTLYAVIAVPSKELCIQICSQINLISNNSGIPVTAAALFGGVNKSRQLQTLKSHPNIAVGTYQRITELIKERKLPAHQVKTFVIDEADRLINKDNIDGILALRKCFMRDIQIILVSASITPATEKMASQLSDKEFVKKFTSEKLQIPENIRHIYFVAERRDKIETVRKAIKALNTAHCIIFANSVYDADEITQKLQYHNYKVASLHGDCDKNKRRQIVDGFRNKSLDYIVCSDMAARGLDFKDVNSVINIGLPQKPVDYLHRAGRCGRAGADGICASIITKEELHLIRSYQKAFGINILPKAMYQGKIVRK